MTTLTFEELHRAVMTIIDGDTERARKELIGVFNRLQTKRYKASMQMRMFGMPATRLVAYPVIKTLKTGKKRYTYEVVPS